MSPTNKSLLVLLLSGALFMILLVAGQSEESQGSINSDIDTAKLTSQQVSRQLNDNIEALSEGLINLSNNTFWQNASVVEWAQQLSSQQSIYQAAGLSILGVHAKANDVLYMRKANRPGQFFELKQPLAKLYKKAKPIRIIQTYQDQPAIILLVPIKTVEKEVIGSFVGVKLLNDQFLKSIHYKTKLATVLLKNGKKFGASVDSLPDLTTLEQVGIEWPQDASSAVWKIALLLRDGQSSSGSFWQIILGVIITLVTMFIIWQQLEKSQKTLKLLQQTLNIDLPIAEQIKQLLNMQTAQSDEPLLDCARAIRERFQQLTQQKKALSLEVRKLQEAQQKLQVEYRDIQAQRDTAVAAPRIKSEFLSRMGDEITTPMKSVVSMLKLLSEYPFDAEPKQLLNIAKRSTRTLVDNLNNILDFSKLDANMLKLKPRQFNVRQLVDDLSSELSHFANEKDLSLQASSDVDVPSVVKADLFRIKQILRNLLGNAIRFTKEGEVTLYADISTKDDKQLLRFTIADTGIGMSPDAQRGIFDSFQQTTKLSNSSFAGRLRLIVSKNLAKLMGGEIGVISEIGKGSQFWFTIAYEDPTKT